MKFDQELTKEDAYDCSGVKVQSVLMEDLTFVPGTPAGQITAASISQSIMMYTVQHL